MCWIYFIMRDEYVLMYEWKRGVGKEVENVERKWYEDYGF